MTSKLTTRESYAILYLSSRVPRTSTEEQLRTRNRYNLKIDASGREIPVNLYLYSRVPRTSTEEELHTRNQN